MPNLILAVEPLRRRVSLGSQFILKKNLRFKTSERKFLIWTFLKRDGKQECHSNGNKAHKISKNIERITEKMQLMQILFYHQY